MTGALRRLGSDPTVRWLAAARVVALLTAPLTLYLLVTRVPVAQRGLYLIAINVVAAGQLFDTGIGTLLVQFAARATSVELGRLRAAATRWFATAALVTVVLGATAGTAVLLSANVLPIRGLLLPWAIVLAGVALHIRLVPLVCLHEGAGGTLAVQRMRAVQALLIAAATVVGLLRGAIIGTAAFAALAQVGAVALFLTMRRVSLPPAESAPMEVGERYLAEQGRSARVWLALWLAPQLLTPVTLLVAGPTAAGEIGLHLALALAPPMLAVPWMHARYPRLGALVGAGRTDEFDRAAREALAQALIVLAAGSAALLALAVVAPRYLPFLADRVLSPSLLALLLVGSLVLVLLQAMLAWFRAFAVEAFATPVILACTTMVLGAIGGAALGGAQTAAAGYALAAVVSGVLLVLLFRLLRDSVRAA